VICYGVDPGDEHETGSGIAWQFGQRAGHLCDRHRVEAIRRARNRNNQSRLIAILLIVSILLGMWILALYGIGTSDYCDDYEYVRSGC
jgi:hypothetical protein